MTSSNLESMLADVGFTPEWLETGVITEDSLRLFHQQFVSSSVKHSEGIRNAAFQAFLETRPELTEDRIDQLLGLRDSCSDGVNLGPNRAIQLIGSCLLTDAQHFALPGRHPWILDPPVGKVFNRISIIRRLRCEATSEVFPEVQRSADPMVHVALLLRSDVKREQLEWMVEHGATRAVRNQARQMLKRRKWRRGGV